ncbi:DUF2599 domain-containing protein [Luteibacter sp. UNCMF366Tsu5.1]|uniref:DUF2599 domain-containing protein n=1 Tax=Luteibacter sp. UNCMF366Tsu5.1 TaxID=1502758 RepID=UPI000908EDAB|nr:DUF2599 domain-containing protein [Luteibacter sp. UNCMF366Tsu5.1]SFW53752.1 Protein of unknown function [Luteibacter sp. UNCMF366Tsu5.1]
MKASGIAVAGIVLLLLAGLVVWIAHTLRPHPVRIVDDARHSTRLGRAAPCDAQTGEGFVVSGKWHIDEYGPVLEVTPTPCGRRVSEDLTKRDSLDMEVIEKFSGNLNWRNTRGMINQLDCHLINFPQKPTWNLEPDRPYVGYADTWAAECNPSVGRPDTPFE